MLGGRSASAHQADLGCVGRSWGWAAEHVESFEQEVVACSTGCLMVLEFQRN